MVILCNALSQCLARKGDVVHMHAQLTVIMAAKPEAPSPLLAALVTGLVLLAVLGWLGSRLGVSAKFDDALRIIVAIVAVAGVLSFIPVFRSIGRWINDLAEKTASGAGTTVVTLVTFVLAALSVWLYYKKPSVANLVLMTILLTSFFVTDFMTSVERWYINSVGVPVWNGLVDFFGLLVQTPV